MDIEHLHLSQGEQSRQHPTGYRLILWIQRFPSHTHSTVELRIGVRPSTEFLVSRVAVVAAQLESAPRVLEIYVVLGDVHRQVDVHVAALVEAHHIRLQRAHVVSAQEVVVILALLRVGYEFDDRECEEVESCVRFQLPNSSRTTVVRSDWKQFTYWSYYFSGSSSISLFRLIIIFRTQFSSFPFLYYYFP